MWRRTGTTDGDEEEIRRGRFRRGAFQATVTGSVGDGAAFAGVGAEAGGRRDEGGSGRRRGLGGGVAPGKAPVSGRGAAQSPGSGGRAPPIHIGSWGGEEGIVRGGEWEIGWVARVPGGVIQGAWGGPPRGLDAQLGRMAQGEGGFAFLFFGFYFPFISFLFSFSFLFYYSFVKYQSCT